MIVPLTVVLNIFCHHLEQKGTVYLSTLRRCCLFVGPLSGLCASCLQDYLSICLSSIFQLSTILTKYPVNPCVFIVYSQYVHTYIEAYTNTPNQDSGAVHSSNCTSINIHKGS